jgi:hypothetical protein
MTSTLLNTTDNEHIAVLESAFDQATEPVQWLVITHDSHRLMNSLSRALAGKSTAVLEASQDCWDFSNSKYIEAIEWAIQQGAITNLVLIGASPDRTPYSRYRADRVRSGSGYERLVKGIEDHTARMHEAQKRFSQHIQTLSQLPLVRRLECEGMMVLHGLFYREESGLFLLYDRESDCFQPLLVQRDGAARETAKSTDDSAIR